MGCLYLHIGTPKTGTSSIQFFLHKNRNVLAKKGYCFPDLGYYFDAIGKNRNAHFMIQRYYDEQNKRIFEKEEALRREGMERVLDCFDQYDHVILSDESVWNQSYKVKDFWKNLRELLAKHGHSLKVIAYLRRQDAYIRSYWAQSVKAVDFKMEFAKYVESKAPMRIHADYLSALDLISSFIGQENIIVRPFERGQFLDGDLYADFLDCLGLSLTDEFNCGDQSKNDTVVGEYIQIKQILNANPAFAVRKGFFVPLVYAATKQRGGKADYRRAALFPNNDPMQFLEQFREGNKKVAQKYLNREDGILFYESPKSEKDLEPYSKEELVMACGDLILELKKDLDKARADQNSLRAQLGITAQMAKQRIKNRLVKKKN